MKFITSVNLSENVLFSSKEWIGEDEFQRIYKILYALLVFLDKMMFVELKKIAFCQQFSTLIGAFRTLSNIYNGAF